jgi:DNA-binding MarR family transcriptional regulator
MPLGSGHGVFCQRVATAEPANPNRGVDVARISTTQECYAAALRRASRRLTALYDETLAPAGLRSTQHAILGELTESTPVTINELAAVLVMDRSSLGHSLRPLQRDGLVRLEQDTHDRRSVNVTLTDEGRRRYAEASLLWRSAQERVADALGASEADALRTALDSLARDERLSSLT